MRHWQGRRTCKATLQVRLCMSAERCLCVHAATKQQVRDPVYAVITACHCYFHAHNVLVEPCLSQKLCSLLLQGVHPMHPSKQQQMQCAARWCLPETGRQILQGRSQATIKLKVSCPSPVCVPCLQVMIGASEVGTVKPLVKEGQHVNKVKHLQTFGQDQTGAVASILS